MEIKEIADKEIWENFLADCEEKTFMHSWNRGEFHEAMGERVWRFGVYDGGELVAVALVAKVVARRGTFLMIEHGPVAKRKEQSEKRKLLEALLGKLKEIAKQESASFIRVSPIWQRNEENQSIFRELGFRQAPMYAATESSWKLDITLSEDELLAGMRKTTRYLIRQALKNDDVEVVQTTRREDLEVFAQLQKEVSARQQFVPFSKKYTESEFDAFAKDNAALLFLGRYKGEVAAAALVIFWSGIGFYHQAGSLGKYTKFSIPYLLQWEAILEAKRRGCKLYDFWGYVDPKKYPKHPWAGPTLFKMGFGGRPYEYVKTQDYPLSWKYWPTAVFEIIRAKRRGL